MIIFWNSSHWLGHRRLEAKKKWVRYCTHVEVSEEET